AALVAQARGRQVALHHRRGGPAYTRLGPLPFSYGTPPAFLVLKRKGDWLQVSLPTRPNGGKAWIKAAAVTLFVTDYEIRVQLRRHRLVLRRGQKTVFDAPIAIGRAVTPTPTGRYFVTYTLRTPDPEGFFGPYALGLSAYSNVVTSFAGGNGQVGIHGTNTPSVLGRDVSHGCIRVGNAVITRLAKTVPLGTPVVIRRT
ncbi:MAG: L,D-transpeptidase, partial [Gaiellaceae bacterium]